MTNEAIISSSVLHGLHQDLVRLHVDERELARHCQLTDCDYLHDDFEIPLHSFVSALEFAAETCRCGEFGWQAGQTFDARYLGELGEAVIRAPTLGVALQVFARYLRLVQSTSEITFEMEGDHLVLSYRILDPDIWPRRQDAEFTLSILCSLIRRSAGDRWQPLYVGFEHEPASDPGRRNEEFGVACAFGCDANTIVLPARLLDAPMPDRRASDWPRLFARLNEALRRRDRARPMRARVESAILSTLGRQAPCQASVADRLGVSPRTLHRRLEAEGTSYGEILSDCRSRLGRFLLVKCDRPLSEIAHDLGYSDYTAFSRAFRADCGRTPKAFRDDRK